MALRYPGGFISSTAPTVNANTAKGVWTLEEAMQYIKAGNWPVATGNGDPYFQYNSILLPGQGTNGAQNNTFLDSSTNNFTITRNGNTTQGTFTPFSQASGYWANYFDGTSDYLSCTSNAAYQFGTGDFTVEMWMYTSGFNGTAGRVFFYATDGNYTGGGYGLEMLSTTNISFGRSTGTITLYSSAPVNQWFHFALVRSSGTLKLYINGVSVYSASDSYDYNYGGSYPFTVGSGRDGSGTYVYGYNGYISNFRAVKGTAVYTSNFTPSTSPLTAVSGTSLLTCQSNRFIDNSTNAFAITANGNTAVTPFEPFGAPTSAYSASTVGGSGYFDGSGDYLTAPSNAAFNIEGGAYTIEGWVYFNSLSTAQRIFVIEGSTTNGFIVGTGSTNNLEVNQFGTGTVLSASNALVGVLNSWAHICVVSNGTNRSIFVNGTRFATSTSALFPSSTNSFGLAGIGGTYAGSNPNAYFSGWRVVKGTAVYDPTQSTLTVPTAPLTAITNTQLLLNFTNAGIIDNAEKNDLETVGNAQISTSQYKWGTSSMYFDGTGDYLYRVPNDLFAMGTGDFTIEGWIYLNSTGTEYICHTGTGANDLFVTMSSGVLRLTNQSTTFATSAGTLSTGQWYHFAVVRTAGVSKVFINGNSGTAVACTTNFTQNGFGVGANFVSGANYLNGYIADLRVTKGFCRYPYNFTAPTAAFPLFYQAAATPSADPYFENTTLLLPGNGTNGAQNNTFLDSSTNAFTITRNGNTTQGTFTPFSQTGWSNYFDGTGDYLSVANNTAFQFGTGDLTAEAWVYPTATPATDYTNIVGMQEYGASASWVLGIDTNLNLRGTLQTTSPSSATNITGGQIPLHQWSHVAMSRSGTVFSIYINGVRVATTTTSQNVDSSGNNLTIGADNNGDEAVFTGYISNVRVVKGTAVYTGTSFTVPTTALTAVSGTSLLTCQSNRFIDNSTNAFTITRNGDTSVQAFSPFNPTVSYSTSTVGGSGYFDGSGDYLTAAANSAFSFGTGAFTLEAWIYVTGGAGAWRTIFAERTGATDSFQFGINTSNKLSFSANGSTFFVSTSDVGLNTWHHVVVSSTGTSGAISLFLNGVREATTTYVSSIPTTSATLYIGAWPTLVEYMPGYMSSMRIVKGSAVYDPTQSTLTVPTAPLTAISGTSLLLSGTNGGITDATAKNDLETVGGASISTTQSKFGGSSLAFDGSGDYLVTPSKDLLNLGSGDFTVEAWVYTSSSVAYAMIIDKSNDGGGGTGWFLEWSSTRGLALYDGSTTVAAAYTVSTGVWYHIAATRYSGNILLFVNGVRLSTTANTTNLTSTTRVTVGATNSTGSYALNGYINDLRVTKGIARYTQNFTPPSTAFLTL